MNELAAYATFRADLPEEGDQKNLDLKPHGTNVAETLRGGLVQRGLAASAVGLHSHYGWVFEVPTDGIVVWCMIQFVDPWLLITDVPGRFFHRLLGRRPGDKHQAILNHLAEVLRAAPFSECIWTTRAAYESR